MTATLVQFIDGKYVETQIEPEAEIGEAEPLTDKATPLTSQAPEDRVIPP